MYIIQNIAYISIYIYINIHMYIIHTHTRARTHTHTHTHTHIHEGFNWRSNMEVVRKNPGRTRALVGLGRQDVNPRRDHKDRFAAWVAVCPKVLVCSLGLCPGLGSGSFSPLSLSQSRLGETVRSVGWI